MGFFLSDEQQPDRRLAGIASAAIGIERRPATMTEIARAGNFSISTVWRWLHGVSVPSRMARDRLNLLGIELVVTPAPKRLRRRRRGE